MSGPDPDCFAPLARRDDDALFDEPWQAQALGLAFSLSERGHFTPAEWSEMLGSEHRKLLQEGAADTPETYYQAVVRAVEHLLREKDPFSVESLEERVSDWRKAYLNTPHGQPVSLDAAHGNSAEKNLQSD